MTPHYDHGPAFRRLAAIHGWDQLPDGPPPITHPAPRPIPPARVDSTTVANRRRTLSALARIARRTA